MVLKHGDLGHLCGYVGVPLDHPDAQPSINERGYDTQYDNVDVSVHGGLTFSEMGEGEPWIRGFYWLGFDCAHAGDFMPRFPQWGGHEWTEEEVAEEVTSLAEQLLARGAPLDEAEVLASVEDLIEGR
jgi:hypothetical protein